MQGLCSKKGNSSWRIVLGEDKPILLDSLYVRTVNIMISRLLVVCVIRGFELRLVSHTYNSSRR